MSRENNIKIFSDTEMLCKTNPSLAQACKESTEKKKVILEGDIVPGEIVKLWRQTKVVVSRKRTFEAAMSYEQKKVTVLNFASAVNPGGGVKEGSSAQEECLCRCSTLYFSLADEKLQKSFYHPHILNHNSLNNDDLIYTPDVVIFKTDVQNPTLMDEKSWKKVNVITCAAPNLQTYGEKNKTVLTEDELKELHIKRGRRILETAAATGNEVIILGAFGCGVFQNKPEIVAAAYAELSAEFTGVFDTIEFAVYCSPYDDTNYRIFNKILS